MSKSPAVIPDHLRPIEALQDYVPPGGPPDLGRKPELVWVEPTSLLVDDTYQRDLNRRSMQLIRKLVDGFAWRKMKPPVCVREGRYLHVIDGQHTATAAATLGLPMIPCFVVHAETAQDRAESFVAHNQDRLTMTALDVHRALVLADDVTARIIDDVLTRAGCRLRVSSRFVKARVGDTAAIGGIRQLVQRRGKDVALEVLRAFVAAGAGPISVAEIQAAEVALCVRAAGDIVTTEQLTRAIKQLGPDGVISAAATAKNERVATKVVLTREYRQRLGRRAA